MKIFRITLLVGVAHFVLWWLSYGVLLWFDLDVLGSSHLSAPLQVVFHVHKVLTFPLMFDPVNSAVQHLPVTFVTAANGFAWAGCLGIALYGLRRIYHVRAAS